MNHFSFNEDGVLLCPRCNKASWAVIYPEFYIESVDFTADGYFMGDFDPVRDEATKKSTDIGPDEVLLCYNCYEIYERIENEPYAAVLERIYEKYGPKKENNEQQA